MSSKENDFAIIKGFKSYVSKPEITDLAPNFLVRGSKNVLIDYANRVISRNGYTRYNQADTGLGGCKNGWMWDTSNGKSFDMKLNGSTLRFDWNGKYNTLKSGFLTNHMMFEKVFDVNEKIDMLIFVTGEEQYYKWSGGVSEVSSSALTTLKKRGIISSDTLIGFVAKSGFVNAKITDTISARFLIEGFAPGDQIYVSGSASNNRVFTAASVTATEIELISSDILVTESPGASVTIHNGEPTWASSRFLTQGTRKFLYNGVEYAYTGGETTDTLTGITPDMPPVTPGDEVWQSVITILNPAGITPGYKSYYVGVQLNQLILASATSLEVFGSSTISYTNFVLTSPRVPGDPFKVTMDSYATCIVERDNQDGTDNSLIFGSGKNSFFKLSYRLSDDNTNELVRMIKLKAAIGSGLISKNAIVPIRDGTAYISNEPAFDMLSSIENAEGVQSVPLSDIIKNDFDFYDFEDCDTTYWKRATYIALPKEGLFLIYDWMRRIWQPPQYAPVGKWTIIDGKLCFHSYVTDETFTMFEGTDDDGVFIPQIARFAYDNGGRRDRIKNKSEYWTDGYITPNGKLTMTQYLGYEGSKGKQVMTILGSDPKITVPLTGSPLGDTQLGLNPLGGSTMSAVPDLPGSESSFVRFFQDDTLKITDYVESFVEYEMNTLGGQFAIVAHASNQWDAGTSLAQNMK